MLVKLQRRFTGSHFDNLNSRLNSDAGGYQLRLGRDDPLPQPHRTISQQTYMRELARASSTQARVEQGVTNAVHVEHGEPR